MAQTTTSHTSKAQEALGVNELLEHVILMLPASHILAAAQRVSKHWCNLIQASSKIQRKLFIKVHASKKVANPQFDVLPLQHDDLVYEQRLETNFVLKDLMPNSFRKFAFTLKNGVQGELVWSIILDLIPNARGLGYPKASWKDMFVTSPPCSVLSLRFLVTTVDYKGCRGEVWIHDLSGTSFLRRQKSTAFQ